MHPSTYCSNRMPIYLYENSFKKQNHISLIHNINSYFKSNGKICFICKKTFKSTYYRHRCSQGLTCFACRRYYLQSDTYVHDKIKKLFCDSKINKQQHLHCKICNVMLYSNDCENYHHNLCNGLGYFGFWFSCCKKFTYSYKNLTSTELKELHKCGEQICFHCNESFQVSKSSSVHICPLLKEKPSAIWPYLAFLNFTFDTNESENCLECYEIKFSFKTSNNLTWKEVYEHDKFPKLVCLYHKNISEEPSINLLIIYKEDFTKRGIFHRYTISCFPFLKCIEDKNILSFDYYSNLDVKETHFLSKQCKRSKDLELILNNVTSLNSHSIFACFLSLIFDETNGPWKNLTVLLQDEDSKKLVSNFFSFYIL